MVAASLASTIAANAQNANAGAVNRAGDTYDACMIAAAQDYAPRSGSPERLAAKAALFCQAELAQVEKAYTSEFFSALPPAQSAEMAWPFVTQIASAMYEVARSEIIRLRIEAEHAQ